MISVFPDVIDKAVSVEKHLDRERGTSKEDPGLKQTHMLVSALKDGNRIIPVMLTVKEFSNNQNRLYMSVTSEIKKEADFVAQALGKPTSYVPSTSKISIADLVSGVNPEHGNFLKYFPDKMLSEQQLAGKRNALTKDAEKYPHFRDDIFGLFDNDENTVQYRVKDQTDVMKYGRNVQDDVDRFASQNGKR